MAHLVTKDEIINYIPQRSPIVMVDALVSVSAALSVTEFFIEKNNIFVEAGHLSVSGLLENIAQTCALIIGYRNSLQNKAVSNGFIGGINKVEVKFLPTASSSIRTEIYEIKEVFSAFIINATVFQQNKEVLSTQMKIFVEDE